MFQPSLETKKKFISWFISNHSLKRRESLWILNYLLNHELLLRQVHFVEHAEVTPKAMVFSTTKPAQESFSFYKNGTKYDNPEVAFHDMRLHWKEECFIELEFPNAYKQMVGFSVLEKNPYYTEEIEESAVVIQELEIIQKEALKEQLKIEINKALEQMDSKRFMELTNQLKELEDGKE